MTDQLRVPEVMRAAPVAVLPTAAGWLFEPKYDGIRATSLVTAAGVQIVSRMGTLKNRQFPELVSALEQLRATCGQDLIVDGEIIGGTGHREAALRVIQRRMGLEDPFRIRLLAKREPAQYALFDLLHLGPQPLLARPLAQRRQLLAMLPLGEQLHLAPQSPDGADFLDRALAEGWEGVMAKRADSRYLPGDASTWLKFKPQLRQEFVVGGWTESSSDGRTLGTLLVGYFEDGALRFAGGVGSGLSHRELADLQAHLTAAGHGLCPFTELPQTEEPTHWVRPEVVVEVRFQEWSPEGKLRSPVFVSLRHDKRAADVRRETPVAPGTVVPTV